MWFFGIKGQVTQEVNSLIVPEFELVRDFMPIQINFKSQKDLIKSKKATLQTR